MDKYFFSKTQNYFSIPSIKLPVVKKELPLERTRSTDLEATEGSQSLSWFKRPLISTKCVNWDKRLHLDLWTAELQHQFSSVAQSCPTLCDPMNRSTPGLPVHHQLPEFTQTHVHRISDAIQPSHPLSSPSLPALNLSQHQGLFKWVSSSHKLAKVLEFQLQHQSFQWTPRTDLL